MKGNSHQFTISLFTISQKYSELDDRQDDDKCANDGAVECEPDEFALFDQVNHPFACQASAHKGGDEADNEGADGQSGHCGAHTHLCHVLNVEQCLAEDGRNDHEERELSQFLFLVAEEEAGGDGASRTGEARQHGDRLGDTDDEGVPRREIFALAGFGPIGESQQ